MKVLILLISYVYVINCILSMGKTKYNGNYYCNNYQWIFVEKTNYLLRKYGGELDSAIADIVSGFPTHTLAIVFDSTLGKIML